MVDWYIGYIRYVRKQRQGYQEYGERLLQEGTPVYIIAPEPSEED